MRGAQITVGTLYDEGLGVPQDYASLRHIGKARWSMDVVSSLAIHGLKRFGLTTPKTPKTAGDWGCQMALRATNLLSSQTMMTHYRDSSVRIAIACGLIAQPFSFVT